ncbi:MAG: RNA polymerase sigma factor [Chloroflexi bacterium]|nr:MAG: RNA polymerase sigma factor [Chloroflexota bacterium]
MPEGEADSRVGQPRAKVLPLPQAAVPDQDYLVWAYQTHVTAIYQYVYSRVGNRPDAEDLTSQVFMKAIQGMRADVSVPELRSWLYKVAQTTLADHWRQYYAEDLTDLGEDVGRAPATRENQEATLRVDALLASLPDTYRRVLELRFLRGYSVRETAHEALNRAGRERKRN